MATVLGNRKGHGYHPLLRDSSDFLRLFFRDRIASAGLFISLIYFALAILDFLYPEYLGVHSTSSMVYFVKGQLVTAALPLPPTTHAGWYYLFGTTAYNIPLLPAMLASLEYDIGYSVFIVVTGTVIGTITGALAGFLGGWVDEVISRITDVFLSLPYLVLALAITFVLGDSFTDIVVALIFVSWPGYTRLARGLALSVVSSKFIEAAVAAGCSRTRNIFSHVIPNILSPAFVQFPLSIGRVILIFAALDFIGLNRGAPFLPELGNLMVIGEQYLAYGFWWPLVIPGLFLVIFIVSLNLMGDGMRDLVDPRMRR